MADSYDLHVTKSEAKLILELARQQRESGIFWGNLSQFDKNLESIIDKAGHLVEDEK